MDHLRRRRDIRTVEDLLPDGMSEDEVEAELSEIREYLLNARRRAWVMLPVVALILWFTLGEFGLGVVATGLVLLGLFMAGLLQLQNDKMERLEQRGRRLIEAAKAGEIESTTGGESP